VPLTSSGIGRTVGVMFGKPRTRFAARGLEGRAGRALIRVDDENVPPEDLLAA
jgi:hypothetical protein